jgi:hypothetical protein
LRKSTVILRKGDLSAPVLAIVVTIGLIAAGLVLLAWFFWFAPQASKTGALQILGQPAVICANSYSNVTISVKNTGSADITVTRIIVGGMSYPVTVSLSPGDSKHIVANSTTACPTTWKYTVDGVVVTTAGTYETSFTVIKVT